MKTAHRIVVEEECEGCNLHRIVPDYGIATLCWDDEFESTVKSVCDAMNRAYAAGRDSVAKKGKPRAKAK